MENDYRKLFDKKKQELMRNFFLDLSQKGSIKDYKRGEIIEFVPKKFCIVVEGNVQKSFYSNDGGEKILYLLAPGEVFGEINYFGNGDEVFYVTNIEDSKVSFLDYEFLDKYLNDNPKAHKYFMHSVVRKYRIIRYQMTNMAFSTATEKLADTIFRIYIQDGIEKSGERIIGSTLTHQRLADLIGCSRVTVTNEINQLKAEGIIESRGKKIIITDLKKLDEKRGKI
ncbi:Crp/Fnr family transcriptional regulator [Proteinivorax tanatarense]|uniref:Crp/Fnr family transcriptional regulator n=1 Tax=Proteinivorax tanatarense TaxID=1260629 RepID=A0AAU7VLG1_9FIRM